MKSIYLLDEILAAASPNFIPKSEILETLGVCEHQLWKLTTGLRCEHDRPIEKSHLGIRYAETPSVPLYLELLSGVTRLSRATKRILFEDALNRKVITVSVKRKSLRLLPFFVTEAQDVVAAEIPEGGVARRSAPLALDAIDAVVEIRKFTGDGPALRRFLGL